MRRRRADPRDPWQLMLPLIVWLDLPEAAPDPPPKWTDTEIACLREAVLMDALGTVLGVGGRQSQQARAEAWDWILDDADHPFSFRACAEAVGCRPDELRVAFARMVERSERAKEDDIAQAAELLQAYLEEPAARRGVLRNMV